MNSKLKGLIRHVATAAGGGLVTYGATKGIDTSPVVDAINSVDTSSWMDLLTKIEVILGLVITLVGTILSWRSPEKRVEK